MAGFDDLIPGAMPYLATESIEATAGADWEWGYVLKDASGALVDMTTGYTAICQIRSSSGTLIETPTVTFPAAGQVVCTVANADTEGITAGRYLHELEITRTSGGKKIKVVGGRKSTFTVLAEVLA